MSVVKTKGRLVRDLNSVVEMDIAGAMAKMSAAKLKLYPAIPERDRVKIMRQLAAALMELDEAYRLLENARLSIRNIDEICVMEAKRGSYKKP